MMGYNMMRWDDEIKWDEIELDVIRYDEIRWDMMRKNKWDNMR